MQSHKQRVCVLYARMKRRGGIDRSNFQVPIVTSNENADFRLRACRDTAKEKKKINNLAILQPRVYICGPLSAQLIKRAAAKRSKVRNPRA